MSDNLLQTNKLSTVEVELLPAAGDLKRELLHQAGQIESVEDAFDAECAAEVLKNLSTAVKDMESARKEVKAPVLDLGKRIDSTAKEWLAELETEKKRITRTLGDYQAEQDRIRRDAERREREKQEAARREAEEALASGDEEGATKATEAIAQSSAKVSESAHRPAGVSVRTAYKFEVEDIDVLFKARPDLCTIQPDNAAIRAAVKKSQSIPGLRVWKESSAVAR